MAGGGRQGKRERENKSWCMWGCESAHEATCSMQHAINARLARNRRHAACTAVATRHCSPRADAAPRGSWVAMDLSRVCVCVRHARRGREAEGAERRARGAALGVFLLCACRAADRIAQAGRWSCAGAGGTPARVEKAELAAACLLCSKSGRRRARRRALPGRFAAHANPPQLRHDRGEDCRSSAS